LRWRNWLHAKHALCLKQVPVYPLQNEAGEASSTFSSVNNVFERESRFRQSETQEGRLQIHRVKLGPDEPPVFKAVAALDADM
jgi:hypothetical protein